jgi:serine protease Do
MPKSQFKRRLQLAMVVVLLVAGLGDYRAAALTADASDSQGSADVSFGAAQPARRDATGPRFGLTVEPLTVRILRELGLPPDTQGVIVSDVESGSVAEEAGLRRGDIIQEVNRTRLTSVREFHNAMQDADTMVMLLVNRRGDHAFVVLEGAREPAR